MSSPWLIRLPPPTMPHMPPEDCPPEQRAGGFLWRAGDQTMLIQWGGWPAGSISTLFKAVLFASPLFKKTKLELPLLNGCLVMQLLFQHFKSFCFLSVLLLPCCLSNKQGEGYLGRTSLSCKIHGFMTSKTFWLEE